MSIFGEVVDNQFTSEDGSWNVEVIRRMDDGELIGMTYSWSNLVYGTAYELIKDPAGKRAIELLEAKGILADNIKLAFDQSQKAIVEEPKLLNSVLSYEAQFGEELDEFKPGWRSVSFQGKIEIIKAHQEHLASAPKVEEEPWWKIW